MARKSFKCLQKVKLPLKFSKFSHGSLYQCTLHVIFFEGRKRKLSSVRHQTCIVTSRNYEPSSELLRFVRGCVQTFVKHANFFTTSSWWHDITLSKVSCFSDHFFNSLELKCHGTPCMCPCRDTNMFENSF